MHTTLSDPLVPARTARRHDLDWIRVIAFGVLILYHIGMFYVPWDWHVKSPRILRGLEPVMLAFNPWRLTLLFFVSGCATRFLFHGLRRRGHGAGALIRNRVGRLLPPLLFAVFVLVPPQSYYQVLEATARVAWPASDPDKRLLLENFWIRYATGTGRWCDLKGACLTTPTWNHMWFVANLLAYSVILAGILALPRIANRIDEFVWTPARIRWLAVGTVSYLIVIRAVLEPYYSYEWYNHALSGAAFAAGFLVAPSETARRATIEARRPALIVALICWAAYAGHAWRAWGPSAANLPSVLEYGMPVIYIALQWSAIVAVLGYSALWLNRDNPVLRYLSGGVFCFYIVHQTIIIVLAHYLAHLTLPLTVEMALLVSSTLLCCLIAYEVARRMPWGLGLLLGATPRRSRANQRLLRGSDHQLRAEGK